MPGVPDPDPLLYPGMIISPSYLCLLLVSKRSSQCKSTTEDKTPL
jgi:hypothetical protein